MEEVGHPGPLLQIQIKRMLLHCLKKHPMNSLVLLPICTLEVFQEVAHLLDLVWGDSKLSPLVLDDWLYHLPQRESVFLGDPSG